MTNDYSIRLKDGTYYQVPEDLLGQMRALYANADAQLQRLVNWSEDPRNAYKLKTRRGAKAFITRNLARRGAVKYRAPTGEALAPRDAVKVDAMAQTAIDRCREMLAQTMAKRAAA